MMNKVRYSLHRHAYGTIIRLTFRFNGLRFVYYPGYTVAPADWNKSRQELRKGAPMWQEINAGLSRLKNEVERLHLESLGSEHLNTKILKHKVDVFWKGMGKPVAAPLTLATYARQLAESRLKSGDIQPSTAKSIETLASQIERFDKSATFESVTLDFYNRFTAFMLSEDKSHNTVASRIKRLKMVMAAALDAGLHSNRAFESSRFQTKEKDADSIYLAETEIHAIEALDLSGMVPHIAHSRDLFLLGVYTGLRYSDFSTLSPGDYHTHDGVFMVRKRMKKTQTVVAAPINDKALAILRRYDMKPPSVTNQALNRALKEIGKMAGIVELQKIEQTRGGVTRTLMVPKWNLITTHTARRSFATLSYLRLAAAGQPIDGIMEITGHKTRREFLKYIKVGAEERAALWAKSGG